MLAWMRMPDNKPAEKQPGLFSAGILYHLTMAFPSWAGALLAIYSITLSRSNTLKIRPR
jgi:hypothetical protein